MLAKSDTDLSPAAKGIGLALVQELVKLHGGSVRVESTLGAGTTFTASIPLGSSHISPDMIHERRRMTGAGARSFVAEALRWLPTEGEEAEFNSRAYEAHATLAPEPHTSVGRPRILIADDNADMRQYLVRLLSERYSIEPVADGEAAVAAVSRQIPDLILTDVMMPRLDGFGVLRAIRANRPVRCRGLSRVVARLGRATQ